MFSDRLYDRHPHSGIAFQRHVCAFEFPSLDDVILILSRSVLVKFAVEWITSCNDYDELCADIEERSHDMKVYIIHFICESIPVINWKL